MLPIRLLFIIISFGLETHPFHISLTDMVYNEDRKRIEIAQKIFWDDLEKSLTNVAGKQVNFLQPEDPQKLENMIEDYLLANNEITVGEKILEINYLGHETEEDAAWFYMESEQTGEPHLISIRNSILIDDFPTQQNIVNFYKNRKPKSFIARKDKTNGILTFD
jgi:hypothetical protein